MNTRSRRHNGNDGFRDEHHSPRASLSLWEDCPILAIKQDPAVGYIFHDDFHNYAAGDWVVTAEAGGSTVTTDAAGGAMLVTTDGDDNDGTEYQLGGTNGECFQLVAGKPLWFEAKLQLANIARPNWMIGLVNTDTDIIIAADDFVVNSGAFFACDNDVNIDYYCEAATSETTGDTLKDITAATSIKLGITWDGIDKVTFWVDGEDVISSTTNLPTELLRPSFGLKNTDGNANSIQIDYIKCVQIR